MNLILIDPSLKSFGGHFYTYDYSISSSSRGLGIRTFILGSRDAEISSRKDFEFIPCFRHEVEHSLPLNKVGSIFLEDLVSATSDLNLDDSSIYFIHTVTSEQILPIFRFVQMNSKKIKKFVIFLRYSPNINPYNPDHSTIKKYFDALKEFENFACRNLIDFVTDSEKLIEEYNEFIDLNIRLVPIPHTINNNQSSRIHSKNLTFLGNARSSKGFQHLPNICHLLQDKLVENSWSINIQSNVMFMRDMKSVVALMSLRKLNVNLYESELSISEYRNLLESSSLILLPYELLWYHSQTSGVFAEALSLGIPVIAPKGTWMSDMLGRSDAGITFAPNDILSLADAISEAIDRIEELTESASKFSINWNKYHNIENFVQLITQ